MTPPSTPTFAHEYRLIRHGHGRLRLLWQLRQLRSLLDEHSFWAAGRSFRQLRRMLFASQSVVSAWQSGELVGFGRATSDGLFRAVLWDVVVARKHQGNGVGRLLVESLLESPAVVEAERIYLMTTNSEGFYEKLGFRQVQEQRLMLREEITAAEIGRRSVVRGHG